jgi:hypothetical protein
MLNETCILVNLQIGMPPQTRLARKASDEVAEKYNTVKNQARVNASLFSKKDIRPLQQVANQARTLFNEMSLPYDSANRILPTESYFEFTQAMSVIATEFDKKKSAFLRDYHIILMRSEMELGALWRAENYPSNFELEQRIGFTIESNVIPPMTAFDELAGLSEEAIKELKVQAEAGQQDKINDALKDLFKRLFKSLNAAAIRLDDVDTHFKDTLIGNIEAALSAIESLNLTEDEDLIELAEEVREVISGITPAELRSNGELRKQTAKETKELVAKVSEFF